MNAINNANNDNSNEDKKSVVEEKAKEDKKVSNVKVSNKNVTVVNAWDVEDDEDSDLLKLLDTVNTSGSAQSKASKKSVENKSEKSGHNTIIKEDGIIFEKGMSLVEFLRKNKAVRDIAEVSKYYSKKDIDTAVKSGKVFKKKNKLII